MFAFLALPLVAIVFLDAGELQVGLLTAATTLGSLLVGLPAGAWIDRWRKRSVLVNTDLARAVVLLTISAAWWADVLSIWLLYAVALVHGLPTVFFDVAYVSYLPHLVGRDNLVEGNAKLASVRSAVSISGPGLAGPLVTWLGAPVTLLASSVGMAFSGLLVARIGKREAAHRSAGASRLVRPILVTDGTFSLFLIMYQGMLLVFLARAVGLGAFGIG